MILQVTTIRCDDCGTATFGSPDLALPPKGVRMLAATYGWFSLWRSRDGCRRLADVCPRCAGKLMSGDAGRDGR